VARTEMQRKKQKTVSSPTLDAVSAKLRDLVLAVDKGALLGSEDSLVDGLGASRSTLRQAARILEREGLLRVKRGLNGGYYGSRPDEKTIQTAVIAYLLTHDASHEDVSAVASVLWVEVLRRAATLNNRSARKFAEGYRQQVLALDENATLQDVVQLEERMRDATFELIESPYMQLLFRINATFRRNRFAPPPLDLKRPGFVERWREAKLMELGAIAEGDVQLAIMAARYMPTVWDWLPPRDL
jgi:GntR family transcriptional repressor for pyruvate dehydrogenase complex